LGGLLGLYVKVLALKEICKASLRYAGSEPILNVLRR
jgi:hypothetical protein